MHTRAMDKVALADLRKSYERDELDEASSAVDPLRRYFFCSCLACARFT